MPFDPLHLTRNASINRAAILNLPGVELPADVRGKRAYELLASFAVSAAIKPHKAALGIAEATPDANLPPALDQCLRSSDAALREHADSVAAIIGVRLGCLLLMLKRGDPVNRQARDDWDDSYWTHWATIQRVIIGGGLNRSILGEHIARHAQDFLYHYDRVEMTVERADYATSLPLIGAARSVPVGLTSALIFDFGQTHIKRAFAEYQHESLAALHLLPSVPSNCEIDSHDPYAAGDEVQAAYRANLMLRVIIDMARAYSTSSPLAVMCSLASYVQNGQPADRGCYGVLSLISDRVEQYFADRLSAELSRPVTFRLIHDGTAAASAYAGAEHAAVIMMGTALGIGFPPPADRVHLLAADFRVGDLKGLS